MQDLNWKTWLIIVAIAVGGTFEMLKRLPNSPLKGWDEDALRGTMQTQPYNVHAQKLNHRSGAPRVLPTSKPGHVAAMVSREQLENFVAQNSPKATEFGHDGKGAEGKDAKAKTKKKKKKKLVLGADEEWEYFTDPLTGKRYRRKKKKEIIPQEEKTEVADDEDKKKDDNAADLMTEVLNTGVVQPPAEPEAELGTLEDWMRRLLTRPDAAETRKFIDAYNQRLVTADIFYKIVKMMLEDSRTEMKELGVVCAGATPSLMSFNLLAGIAKTMPGSSTVRQNADKFLGQYAAIRHLSILERVLKVPSIPFNTVLAAQKLELSANTYLSAAANKPPKDPSTQPTTTVHSNATHYTRFVSILEGLTKNSDASIKNQATQTLNTLQSLLGGADTPPVTPPTTLADVQDPQAAPQAQ